MKRTVGSRRPPPVAARDRCSLGSVPLHRTSQAVGKDCPLRPNGTQ
ncbi:MAG: hypothetical protein LBQ54_12800 [Planctomycetaceae bacterium]|nr:hypothetical protein [Planctomycetaceae bacterium]